MASERLILRDVGNPTFQTETGQEEAKLREMILYISQKCADDPDFGATKLNKILYLADGISFAQRDVPITGVNYMHRDFGPVPRRLLPIRQEMIDAGELVLEERERFTRTQKRPVALRKANLSLFSADDIALVDAVIDAVEGRNATELSDISHELNVGWKLTEDGEPIPYEAFMLSLKPLSEAELRFIDKIMEEHVEG